MSVVSLDLQRLPKGPLFPGQRRILQSVQRLIDQFGYAPSVREIGQDAGLVSSSTVHGHLTALAKKGYIVYEGRRRIRVLIQVADS